MSLRPQRYVRGDYPAQCDRCGLERLASDLAQQCASAPGNPLYVCRDTCLDPPHPNDSLGVDPPRVPAPLPFVRKGN